MSVENEVSGSGVRPLMPQEMRELDELAGEEAVETFREKDDANTRQKNETPKITLEQGRNMFAEAYLEILPQPARGGKRGRTYMQLIALQDVTRAARGDSKVANQIADRIGGKPVPAAPSVEVPVRERIGIDLSALSRDELKTLDQLLDKAKVGQQNNQIVATITGATAIFVKKPSKLTLRILQEAQNELLARKQAHDQAELTSVDSAARADTIDAIHKLAP